MRNFFFFTGMMMVVVPGCMNRGRETAAARVYAGYLCNATTTDWAWYTSGNRAPLFEGMGDHVFPASTDNELAGRYFTQGMVLAYAFNHAEAARSFYYATRLDPEFAMAYWGYAYVLGPNYNAGMEPGHYERAYEAIQSALEYSSLVTPREAALIRALAVRYVKEPVEDRSRLEEAYSRAMQEVWKEFPDDTDAGTLYAESLMLLHPWDLYDRKGNPLEWTPEIIETLDQVLRIDPRHPGANHFYIHAVEGSSEPQRGLKSARLFDDGLVPAAGHLVHMPSHIYIRTGDYHLGSLSNLRAVEVDSVYTTACHAQGVYPLAYYPHNYHFLVATATLEGKSEWAIEAADRLALHTHGEIMKETGWTTLQHYYTIPLYVYVKFGKWEEILAMENSEPSLKYPQAIRAYARGMAFEGLGETDSARKELEVLAGYSDDPGFSEFTIWDINSADVLLGIAAKVLEGEILAGEGKFKESIALLEEAVELEDGLNYNEPPDWFFSVRHHLGAVQMEAGLYEDAIRTYEEDLEILPVNGWALHGLKEAYTRLGNTGKAGEVETLLEKAWATADIELTGSRI